MANKMLNKNKILINACAQVISENRADVILLTTNIIVTDWNDILPSTIWTIRNLLLILVRAHQATMMNQALCMFR